MGVVQDGHVQDGNGDKVMIFPKSSRLLHLHSKNIKKTC